MNVLAINSFIFFTKQAIKTKEQMANDYLTDDHEEVLKKFNQFNLLVGRAKKEREKMNAI